MILLHSRSKSWYFHPSLYYNWAARAFGRLVPVMRWWMFQSELYFVRCSGSERRDRAGAGLTESGQFHQIIWFIGKINWVLQKLYSKELRGSYPAMYKVLLEIYVGILIGIFPKLHLILSIYSINFLLNIENLFQFRDTNILLFADSPNQ